MGMYGNTPNATIASPDLDNDNMPDSWEKLYWPANDPSLNGPNDDTDLDTITNIQEYHWGLNSAQSDSDSDGLADNWEIENGMDALSADTDMDGMPDAWEVSYGLDATDSSDASLDSDSDGLVNRDEYLAGSSPNAIDSDGDGLSDQWEVQAGINPADPNDQGSDLDNDGYTNGAEYLHGSDPADPNSICVKMAIVVPTDVNSIQRAIEWSIDGDEIEVLPGMYDEYVAVDGKNIHLHSSYPNDWDVVKSTIIMNDYWLLLKDNNSNMLLEGVTISNDQYGIWCTNSDATVRKCIIENSNRGIYCSNSSSGTIAENIIRSNALSGVLANSSDSRIKNNVIYANGDGIHVTMAPDSSIINNTVYGNVDYGISVIGIQPIINNNIVFNNGNDLNGCTATYSCVSDGDSGIGNISSDPSFVNTFDFWDTTISDGSVATIVVADPNLYIVGDVIEYQNDGVVHIVTDVDMTSREVSFDVPLYANSVSGAIIFNWGPSATNIEENFHLKLLSPCINAGDPNGYYYDQSDIDGDPRIRGVAVDIGADEAPVMWYVDNDANGLKTGYSETDAVTCIQEAIDLARNGDTIVVYPGNYQENIDFKSKSIAIQSIAPGDWSIINQTEIEASDPNDPVVTFTKTEDANSILIGFTIKNGTPGIKCEENASPVITHCRVTENQGGGVIGYIDMFSNITNTTPTIENCVISDNNGHGVLCSRPSIINCTVVNNTGIGVKGTYGILVKNSIIWGNSYQIAVPSTYSCIQGDDSIDTNIGYFPYFNNPDVGDYTLLDYSPCIDAGDPNSAYKNEMNGGGGRINLGAYGNTSAATLASIDADADELPDTWELLFWTGDPNLCDPNADPDMDLLVNRIEYQIGTNPTDSDTDNDGIDDGWEYNHQLDPLNADDAAADKDSDGLTNLQEYIHGTDLNDSDSDNDGMYDGWEVSNGLNPLYAEDKELDLDNDGYSNYVEYLHNGDPNDGNANALFEKVTIIVPTVASTIQQGIDWSLDGDTIKVLPGTYTELVDYDGKAITITGSNTDDWKTISRTVINAGNGVAAVIFASGEDPNSILEGVTITSLAEENPTNYGIVCESGSSPTIRRCIIEKNGLDGIHINSSSPVVSSCMIGLNQGCGFASAAGFVTVTNCWIYNNSGSGMEIFEATGVLVRNNTIARNLNYGIYIYQNDPNSPLQVTNSILWNNTSNDIQGCVPQYCCISDGGSGTNISDDPMFLDPNDYDYRIDKDSPCVDLGNPNTTVEVNEKDIFGQVRLARNIDMGADEVCAIWNATQNVWYKNSIQQAINEANPNDIIQLYEWVFDENINYQGKPIIIQSTDPNNWDVTNSTVIYAANPNDAAITFNHAEDNASVISGITIRGGQYGILCDEASPIIRRCSIQNNDIGILCNDSVAQIINNKIGYNGNGQGAGIVINAETPPTIATNLIYKNDSDPRLSIDNNLSERTLRMVVIGRKNYLFAGSEAGAERAAIIYSLVASCKMNGHAPFAYFHDVLKKVTTWPAHQIDALLPSYWTPPKLPSKEAVITKELAAEVA